LTRRRSTSENYSTKQVVERNREKQLPKSSSTLKVTKNSLNEASVKAQKVDGLRKAFVTQGSDLGDPARGMNAVLSGRPGEELTYSKTSPRVEN